MRNSRLLVLLISLLSVWQGLFAENQPYAYLNNGKLILRYDDNWNDVNNPYVWEENEQAFLGDNFGNNVTQVIFEPSFSECRPTSTAHWFSGMENLKSITGLEYLNTEAVTEMHYMFNGCSKLTSLDLTNFNTEKVINMSNMFENCSSLEVIYAGNWYDIVSDNFYSSYRMFAGCENLPNWNENNFNDINFAKPIENGGYFSTRRAYAIVEDDNLTFHYDGKNTDEVTYTIDQNAGGTWKTAAFTTVTFDPSFADYKLTSTAGMFSGKTGLTTIYDLDNLNTYSITDMSNMFNGCSGLTTLDCGKDWSAMNVPSTDMFAGCENLVGAISYDNNKTDITYANPTNGYFYLSPQAYAVLDANGQLKFYYDTNKSNASGTVYDIPWNTGDPDDWNDPEWVNYDDYDENGVLIGNTAITSVAFDASFSDYRLESAFDMFALCTALTSIDFTNFNTSNVKSMSGMFDGCRSLTALELSSFDTGNVTDMSWMFYGCSSLTSIDLSTFNTETVYDMSYMFDNCESLTSLDLSKFNTGNVSTTEYMFHKCTSLTSLDLTNFDMSNVIFADHMFFDCKYLKTIFCNDNWYREGLSSDGMFYGCSSLQGAIEYDEFETDACYANPTNGYFTSNVKQAFGVLDNGKLTFYYAPRSIVDVSLPILDFDLNNPAWKMPNYVDQIVSIEFSESFQEYEDIRSPSAIFAGMTNLTEVTGLHNLNTSHVTSMSYLFEGCSALETLDLSGLNTSSVTDMSGMFYGCTALRALDLTGWDVSNVSSMYSMFVDCQKLSRIYCNDDWTQVFNGNPTVEEMFYKAGQNLPLNSASGSLEQLKPTTEGGIFIKREAYAVVSDGNLTFYHDGNKPAQGTVYSIDHNGAGDWKNANFTTITFDDSFKSFKLWTTADMFSGLTGLTTIFGLSNLNVSCVTDMSGMFNGCSSLATIYCNDDWSARGKVESSDNMFTGCAVSDGANVDVASAKPTSGGYFTTYAAPYAVRVDKWTLNFQYGNPPAEGTIYDVVRADFYPEWRNPLSDDEPYTIITSVEFDPSFADYHGLTSTANMFSDLSNLSSITGLQYLDTENVTDMSEMFSGCVSLGNLTFSENFNTSKVTDMREMFSGCTTLSELDLTGFNTAEVIDMRRMFNNCINLTTIYSNSDWSIHEAIGRYDFSSSQMFTDCEALQGGNNTLYSKYNDNDITYARPDDQYHSGYFTSTVTLLDITLYDGQSNAQTISDNLSMLANVTLNGRTLYKDGDWNTLCLPFSVEDGNANDGLTFSGTPLEGAIVMTLDNSADSETGFDPSSGTLTLNFVEANTIEAGTPYIIKWENTVETIEDPTFTNVTLSSTLSPVVAPSVTFMGNYDPQPFTSANTDILYLGASNTLYYPSSDMTINAFRAYFQMNLTSGQQVKAFVLNFGDEETGIFLMEDGRSKMEDAWYGLDGRRLLSRPATPGLYIHNNHKVLIK